MNYEAEESQTAINGYIDDTHTGLHTICVIIIGEAWQLSGATGRELRAAHAPHTHTHGLYALYALPKPQLGNWHWGQHTHTYTRTHTDRLSEQSLINVIAFHASLLIVIDK